MSRRPRDPLSIVEASYELHASEAQWIEGILEAALPRLDDGNGAMAFVIDPEAPAGEQLRSPVAFGGDAEWQAQWRAEVWERLIAPVPVELATAAVAFGPLVYSSHLIDALARELPTMQLYIDDLRRRGIVRLWGRGMEERPPERQPRFPEALAVHAADPSGHAVVITGNRAQPASRLPSRASMRSWDKVASHVTAAFRVRRKLGALGLIPGAEAVIAPGGEILHAQGEAKGRVARSALRRAAIGIDRARTAMVRDTDEALELWRALHAGRWSVLDTFDSDGRRFIVARANEPASDPAPTLARREQQVVDLLALGHSNKLIAYDLGISVSSVATHLRRAASKLGVTGTRDLVRWARARARPRD